MERIKWPGLAVLLGALCALIRRWQLSAGLEGALALPVRGAPASIAMAALLVISAAVFCLMAYTARKRLPEESRMSAWDLVFAAEGDTVYLTLMVLSALACLGACPLLLREAREAYSLYLALKGGDNGLLYVAAAVCALAACAGLLLSARDAYRMKGRGRELGVLLLPVLLSCVWLLAAYRKNAPDPVLWRSVPLLLAVAMGLLFLLETAALSFEKKGRPRLLLWLAAMTVVTGGCALATGPALSQAVLLVFQTLAALAALWVAPKNLSDPPAADRYGLRARRRQGLPLNETDETDARPGEAGDAEETEEDASHE